ncbi:type II toxin-antitoxin system death-on-curing family toxin [Veillonella intestinalis]|uniref:type II toxin-antitoxin system death-on-curing family toxin n=1 Tax=Veillonella intestinalis TaxID=2941341 RepID=UPI00203C1E8D|nr:type II toxin-antitoxin system death-on-curing family toxin [Veillonella intestinalis]
MEYHEIQILLDNILMIHEQLSNIYKMEAGVRDIDLLDSAVNAPFQTFCNNDLYPTIYLKAAKLCHGLAKNHPFVDGNKRTALQAMLLYLALNNVELQYTNLELETLILDVVTDKMKIEDITKWIHLHEV